MAVDQPRDSPLLAAHEALGARLIDFAGWHMPVQYAGILPEHQAVRSACGVFDISHMGQLVVTGGAAEGWLNECLTNDTSLLAPGQAHYTLLLNERGGVIDDLLLYRLAPDRFLLLVNASMIDEDEAWLRASLPGKLGLENASDSYAGLAVQGPSSVDLARSLSWELPTRNEIVVQQTPHGEAFLCRTGYTGEDGFEIFLPNADSTDLWERLLTLGVTPCGLGARDTLRLEMGYPLNGSDLSPDRTPLEAGLGFFVHLDKPSFTGRAALAAQKEKGGHDRLVGLVMEGKGPPLRGGYELMDGDTCVGILTSGCLSPSLGYGIGMAYLPSAFAKPGTALEVVIRNRRFPVTTAKKSFYRPPQS